MYKWKFSGVTTCGKQIMLVVYADDKRSAINTAFTRIRSKGYDSIRWDCHLAR